MECFKINVVYLFVYVTSLSPLIMPPQSWRNYLLSSCKSKRCFQIILFYFKLCGYVGVLEKETATHSSILASRIPWTEEPGGLQSRGSQRTRHDLATEHIATTCSYLHFNVLKLNFSSKSYNLVFQVFNSHMWQVATALVKTDYRIFPSAQKALLFSLQHSATEMPGGPEKGV